MKNEVFTDESLFKMYFRFALPVVFSMVVTMIYNLADTYFIAATGNTILVAGVSLCAPVFTFLMAVGNVFAQGGCSLASRLLGRQNGKAVRHVSAFCVHISWICGIMIGIFMLIFHQPVLFVLGADADTFPYAAHYYTILAIGAPLVVVSFVFTNLLRAVGLSKEAMIGTISGAVINIVLDPLFIFGLKLGSKGAAIATVLGYLCADAYCFLIFMKRSSYLSVKRSEITIPCESIKQILGIGIPAALTNIMSSISVGVTNQFLLPYGNDKIAAMGIVLKIYSIVLLVLTGLAFGGQPLYGFYFGSDDKKQLSKLYRFCVIFISAAAIILSLFVYIAAPDLLRCFLRDSQNIIDGTVMLRLQIISTVFVGFVLLNTIVSQSAGKMGVSFLLSVSRQGLVFLPVILIAEHAAGYHGILASQAIADIITALGICLWKVRTV